MGDNDGVVEGLSRESGFEAWPGTMQGSAAPGGRMEVVTNYVRPPRT